MDLYWTLGRVMAALEQVPGEPSDLTALLRESGDRKLLLGGPDDCDGPSIRLQTGGCHSSNTELGKFLAQHLDLGRVEAWSKILERGVQEGRFEPILFGTPEYPSRLAAVYDAPPILFRRLPRQERDRQVAVPADDGSRPAIAIVGSRDAGEGVLNATRELAEQLARRDVRIVSGLATGVDTAAHEGALQAGTTTAVMGTGVDRVFPEANIGLAAEIAASGVVLSQFAPHAPRTGTTFLRRNCVIAALSDVSLVMDADETSGSRHELEQAVRYGKPVLLWRPSLGADNWSNLLLKAGAATFVESIEGVTAVLQ